MTRLLRAGLDRVRAGGDAGFALVLVMGMSGAILALVAVATLDGTRALRSGASHVSFEGALAAAEAGIDTTLQTVSLTYNSGGGTYTTPGTCARTAPSTFADEEAERTWARTTLEALPASCLRTTPGGEYVALRPTGRQAVYAMGWAPNRANARAERRLIKAEYLFSPYKPTNAVLTQGSLDFGGSVAVNAVGAASSADVHSNQSITGINGSTSIEGAVSASGAVSGCGGGVTGGCTAASPVQSLPVVSARVVYLSQALANPGAWFDLCPDGAVRTPAAAGSPTAGTPCTGPVVAATGGHHGWTFSAGSGTTPPTWTLPKTAGGPFPGVYYAYRGNAEIGGTGISKTLWQLTVLAEAAPTGGTATSCGKLGGDVSWKLFDMTPYLPGLMVLADANLVGGANNDAGHGLFLAGDRVSLQTSSATINGAVIAANQCAAQGLNEIQGVTINFDDTIEAPLSDVIRTSLWLEYPAG